MKTIFLKALALSILFVACSKNNTQPPIAEEEVAEEMAMGTVSLKPLVKDAIDVKTGKAPPLDDVLENLYVEIYDFSGSGNPIIGSQYNDLPEFIELPRGINYSVNLYSLITSIARFDSPAYGNSDTVFFDVIEGVNTTIDIPLSLLDIALTIDFSEEVIQSYTDIAVKAYIFRPETFDSTDDVFIEFDLLWAAIDDLRTGYFNTKRIEFLSSREFFTDLVIEVTALDTWGNEIFVSKTYSEAIANQHYKIIITNAEPATVDFDISFAEEEVIEDEITFPN